MSVSFHRIAACAAVAAVAICALAATASAKDGFHATLTSTLPADAKPGTKIKVAWTVTNDAGDAFNATDVFVRLRGPAGSAATEGFASFKAHTDGSYTAQVAVPDSGIAGVEIGVAGTRTYSSGKSERADYLFPISNPPDLASTGGSGTSTLTWLLPLVGGLAALAILVLALRRRTIAPPQARISH